MGLFGQSNKTPQGQEEIQTLNPGAVVSWPKRNRDHVLKRTRDEDVTSTQQKDKQVLQCAPLAVPGAWRKLQI